MTVTSGGDFAIDQQYGDFGARIAENEEHFHKPGRQTDILQSIEWDVPKMLVPPPCRESFIFGKGLADREDLRLLDGEKEQLEAAYKAC